MRRGFGRTAVLAAVAAAAVAMLPGTADAGGGCHGMEYSQERSRVVTAAESCMVPAVVRVDEGATVRFLNKDPIGHMFDGVAGTFGTFTELGQGEWVEYRFDGNGVYPFFCLLHPGMVGAVVVGDGSGPGPGAPGEQVVHVGAGSEDGGSAGSEESEAASEAPVEAASARRDPVERGWWVGLGLGAVAAAGLSVLVGTRRRRAAALAARGDQPA